MWWICLWANICEINRRRTEVSSLIWVAPQVHTIYIHWRNTTNEKRWKYTYVFRVIYTQFGFTNELRFNFALPHIFECIIMWFPIWNSLSLSECYILRVFSLPRWGMIKMVDFYRQHLPRKIWKTQKLN